MEKFFQFTIMTVLTSNFRLIKRALNCRTDGGEMFVVKDPDKFAKYVIPQYFHHNKFSSFTRQLNFYQFRKVQVGRDIINLIYVILFQINSVLHLFPFGFVKLIYHS